MESHKLPGMGELSDMGIITYHGSDPWGSIRIGNTKIGASSASMSMKVNAGKSD